MDARLKFEIPDIINSMLDSIPNDVIVNGTFLDPAIGGGQFVLEVERRKRSAGKTDEEIRETVFGFERNLLRLNYAKNKRNLVGTYIHDDVFRWSNNMKFDVVLMNPPYQKDTNTKKDEDNKQGSFWYQFVNLGINKLKDDGHLVVICPKSIFGSGGYNTKAFKVGQMVKSISFSEIWPDLSKHFKVGIEILGFSAVKNSNRTHIKIAGTNDTINIDGKYPVPFYVSKTSVSVINKCFNISKNTIGFKESIRIASETDIVLKVNGGRFKQWKKTFIGMNNDTKHNQQGAIIPAENFPGYASAVKSELWEYVFKVMGGEKGNSTTGLMDRLPIMKDMTRSYSNEEWYSSFEITEEEQKNIKKFLSEYK